MRWRSAEKLRKYYKCIDRCGERHCTETWICDMFYYICVEMCKGRKIEEMLR